MPFTLEGAQDAPAPKTFKLDGARDADIGNSNELKPIGRGQLAIKNSRQEPLSEQSLLDATMMIPALGAEGAALKGAGMLENSVTRAYPKAAQYLAEGNVLPFISNVGKATVAGGVGGATYGVGTGRDITESAAIGAVGSGGSEAVATTVPSIMKILKKYMGNATPEEIEKAAKETIQNLQAKDVRGGGLSADEISKQVKDANEAGKPMIVPDIAGENIKGKAGTIARVPGVGKQQAQQFFKSRDEAAAQRLSGDLDKYLGSGSAKAEIKKTAQQRSASARPLFEKAYLGGSLAPLEKQYQKAWQEATKVTSEASKDIPKIQSRITILKGKMSQTSDIYQQAALQRKLTEEERRLSETTQKLATARDDERLAQESMKGAQKDRVNSAPGAVWSPKIQRWLANPEVKSGINRGLQIERNLADASGHPFNVTEYAATGVDKEGNPIISKVPNMRLLATAKEGLDARLLDKDIRDEKTGILTKYGVSIQKLRDSLREELVRLNPEYGKALDSWAGDSAIINATNYGKNIALKQSAEDIAEELSKMSPSEKDAARVGISDELKVRLSKTAFNGDESKKILNSEYMKAQLKPFFKDEKSYEQFVKNVSTENTMFQTPVILKGKSPTAEREAVDADKNGLWESLIASKFNPKTMLNWLYNAADNSGWKNKAINDEIAKLLFNPNIPIDYLKKDVVTGAPKQRIMRKLAPYVGTGIGEILNPDQSDSNFNQFLTNQ